MGDTDLHLPREAQTYVPLREGWPHSWGLKGCVIRLWIEIICIVESVWDFEIRQPWVHISSLPFMMCRI